MEPTRLWPESLFAQLKWRRAGALEAQAVFTAPTGFQPVPARLSGLLSMIGKGGRIRTYEILAQNQVAWTTRRHSPTELW